MSALVFVVVLPSIKSDDILVGGAGNDTLTGAGGRDIFDYGFKNAGNDTITDFILGNTTTNTNADIKPAITVANNTPVIGVY
jgi:Ca2+-binding RTX toxin-like protein